MELHLRESLEDLARKLHLMGDEPSKATELKDEVQSVLDSDEHHDGFIDQLNEAAVAFELDHPALSSAILQIAQALS